MVTALAPAPAYVDPAEANDCADCGAPTGDPCHPACPSASATAAAELHDADQDATHHDEPCCSSPIQAARSLCGCWGGAAA